MLTSLKSIQSFALMLATAVVVAGAMPAIARAQATRFVKDSVAAPDGVRIVYEAGGLAAADATTLVLVHGWSCDRSYWSGQMAPLAERYRVVAIDLAGHGESGTGRTDYTMASFGGDVAAVVEKLALRHVVLVGHSMGGDVIAEAAKRLPGRVQGLVWADTYRRLGAGRSAEFVQGFTARLSANFKDSTRAFVRSMFRAGADQALVERVAEDMSSAPPAVALSALRHAFDYSREMPRALAALELPVVAINPDDSPTDTASMQRHGVQVLILPGTSHFLMQEDPAGFNRLLGQAVEALRRTRAGAGPGA